jgi:hypothetical protein
VTIRRVAALVVMVALLLAVLALPAQADPPEQFETDAFNVFLDSENELVLFWNTTRDAFCDWVDSDFEGPSPVIELVAVREVETGKGAIVGSFRATRPVEMWTLDEGADLSGPCADTDDQSAPWATGEITVNANDNDLVLTGTRTNSFGDRGHGAVVDAAGCPWPVEIPHLWPGEIPHPAG